MLILFLIGLSIARMQLVLITLHRLIVLICTSAIKLAKNFNSFHVSEFSICVQEREIEREKEWYRKRDKPVEYVSN